MTQANAMRAISKITAETVIGKMSKQTPFKAEDAARDLFIVTGIIASVKCTPSTLDPSKNSVSAKGEFVATNCATGEKFTSALLYPTGAAFSDMLENASAGFMFSVKITVKHSARTVQGYAFDFVSLINVTPSESMAQLEAIVSSQNLLPAPKAKKA